MRDLLAAWQVEGFRLREPPVTFNTCICLWSCFFLTGVREGLNLRFKWVLAEEGIELKLQCANIRICKVDDYRYVENADMG